MSGGVDETLETQHVKVGVDKFGRPQRGNNLYERKNMLRIDKESN